MWLSLCLSFLGFLDGQINFFIRFGRESGHWTHQWKLWREDTVEHLFLGEGSVNWVSNFTSSSSLLLHSTFSPDRVQTAGFIKEETACQNGKVTLFSALGTCIAAAGICLPSKEWLIYFRNNVFSTGALEFICLLYLSHSRIHEIKPHPQA